MPTRKPPTWSQCYRIGAALAPQIEHNMTLQEVADELEITRQNAYTESVVALGKLVLLIRRRWRIPANVVLNP
jgi:hypothetical protein